MAKPPIDFLTPAEEKRLYGLIQKSMIIRKLDPDSEILFLLGIISRIIDHHNLDNET